MALLLAIERLIGKGHSPTYDGVIHDDGSLPQEYEPIDFKQHVDDAPIDAGLAID